MIGSAVLGPPPSRPPTKPSRVSPRRNVQRHGGGLQVFSRLATTSSKTSRTPRNGIRDDAATSRPFPLHRCATMSPPSIYTYIYSFAGPFKGLNDRFDLGEIKKKKLKKIDSIWIFVVGRFWNPFSCLGTDRSNWLPTTSHIGKELRSSIS